MRKGTFPSKPPAPQLAAGRKLTASLPLVRWQEALETFLNTLNSPRTVEAYERAAKEAMEVLDAEFVGT